MKRFRERWNQDGFGFGFLVGGVVCIPIPFIILGVNYFG